MCVIFICVSFSSMCEQFDNFKKIGQGGFGIVYRAHHKLDGVNYAIKKIELLSLRERDESVREVKIMAKLNHINIVAYKNAWIEPFSEDNHSISSQSDEFSPSRKSDSIPNFDDIVSTCIDIANLKISFTL